IGFGSNLLALFLVVTKSANELAEYRKLLIIFLLSDLVLTVLQDLLKPAVVVSGDLFLVFSYSDLQSKWLLSAYAGCISISFVIFSFHFLFRALTISSKRLFVVHLDWKKLTFVCAIFLGEGALYTVASYNAMSCGEGY
ncbi:hypothetical protein PMAYCL1PPCAC_16857, partial [Pristionchus mayeri]